MAMVNGRINANSSSPVLANINNNIKMIMNMNTLSKVAFPPAAPQFSVMERPDFFFIFIVRNWNASWTSLRRTSVFHKDSKSVAKFWTNLTCWSSPEPFWSCFKNCAWAVGKNPTWSNYFLVEQPNLKDIRSDTILTVWQYILPASQPRKYPPSWYWGSNPK